MSKATSSTPAAPTAANFQPFIPATAAMREFTPRAVIMGTVLGMIFGASSLYLVLKVGLTVSASIPVAVISITLFRMLSKLGFKDATILENNIVQSAGSAGESIAFGVGVTMPAILILGFDLELTRVLLVAILGGLLGVLMMIPLRRALIVAQHGVLKYPEGTACAEVLKAGASEECRRLAAGDSAPTAGKAANPAAALAETNPATIFIGFAIGLVYKTLMAMFRLWKDVPERIFGAPFKGGSISAEISPELLGVGYIIGPRIASIMCAGGVLSYLVLIPAIKFFGDHVAGIVAPGGKPISEMAPHDVRGAYVLYIGAGAVAAGGIVSVLRSLPTILHALRSGLRDFSGARGDGGGLRTDRDIPLKAVLIGCLGLLAAITVSTPLNMNIMGALMIVVFGFIFVTVSSRLTGEIGSSSNPISGMTVATLLLTCLIFLLLDWTAARYYVTALSVGGIVCIASSNGGTTSQSIKTGYLVGATPRAQQIALLIGALASALILGPVLMRLNSTATVYVPMTSLKNVPATLHADPSTLQHREKLVGPQGVSDPKEYLIWHNTDEQLGPAGRYLVNTEGFPVYLVDPGINGAHRTRPDGSTVEKFDAPKATLMSYIIKGILSRKLPWGLVLIGAMIALVLEMSFLPSLAFATGVYLPLSSSTPIFFGGLVRWLVDLYLRKKHAGAKLTEDELAAEGDKSAGVLMASGYIAGGAIAGILIAFIAGLADPNKTASAFQQALAAFNTRINEWAAHNPFTEGPSSDLLALLPFVGLVLILYLAGREVILAGKKAPAR